MKKRLVIFLMLLLSSPVIFAHRLNEYLEATTINLTRDNVFLELRLTPGVDVATTLLKNIDTNGDNNISEAEKQVYLSKLNHDLSLILDGRNQILNAVSFSFPTASAIKKGIGDIIVGYKVKIEHEEHSHLLQLKNAHYSAIGVYLVNCLLPADTGIHVVEQNRSVDQSFYQLNFATGHLLQQATSADQQQSLEKTNRWAVLKTYFVHGIQHILTGYDHLLFLCALVLGAAGLWDLIKIVTAFTIAHSITLALATFGLAHLPEGIVEPIIAASIVFVAVQNMVWPEKAGTSIRLAVAFFFGLFHGLGFAGGLLELMHAMPNHLIVCALLGFSIGVEAGNQLVLLPLYGAFRLIKQTGTKAAKPKLLSIVQRYASGAVALAGAYYLCTDLWIYF